jgi:hypothetical protein
MYGRAGKRWLKWRLAGAGQVGEAIFQPGEVSDRFFLVLSGGIALETPVEKPDETTERRGGIYLLIELVAALRGWLRGCPPSVWQSSI